MSKRKITGALLRKAATYLSESVDMRDERYPFMCHAVKVAGGDEKEFMALLIEAEAVLEKDWLMVQWPRGEESLEAFDLNRQSVRFMLLLFLAEMLESEAT